MTTRYILFDHDPAKTKIWSKRLGSDHPISVMTTSVDAIQADIYVSPANGYGQLDGGIDKVYRTMFPGIQKSVDAALKPYASRKPMLGVGSALIVPVPNRSNRLLLAPTMDLPTRLKTPWNAFWAALAIFVSTARITGIIAIPGLGTGTGGLDADEMIEMIKLAWELTSRVSGSEIHPGADWVSGSRLILINSLHEQPIPERIRALIRS